MKVKDTQSCLTLCNSHGILQIRILKWIAFPFSRGSSQPRDWTQVSRIAGGFFTSWATREAPSPTSFIVISYLDSHSSFLTVVFVSSPQATTLHSAVSVVWFSAVMWIVILPSLKSFSGQDEARYPHMTLSVLTNLSNVITHHFPHPLEFSDWLSHSFPKHLTRLSLLTVCFLSMVKNIYMFFRTRLSPQSDSRRPSPPPGWADRENNFFLRVSMFLKWTCKLALGMLYWNDLFMCLSSQLVDWLHEGRIWVWVWFTSTGLALGLACNKW